MQEAKRFSRFYRLLLLTLLWAGIGAGYMWLFFAAITPSLPHQKCPLLFYSNQSRQDIKLTFSTALRRADKSLFLMMYGITDPEVIQTLAKKAQEGKKVEVLYDKSASSNLIHKLPKAQAQPFTSKGLMHRKIVIIDDAIVFLGSANLTTASLKHHDNLVVGLYHKNLAQFLKEQTNRPYFSFEIAGQLAELWLLPDINHQALDKLLFFLANAQEKIQIAMFTLTHPQIADALIEAQKRGVQTQIAIDYYTARGASRKTIEKLKRAGVTILLSRGQELLHHKWALIDQQTFVMGSANWTKAAFAKNEDFLLFFPQLNSYQKKFLIRLWNVIEQESF